MPKKILIAPDSFKGSLTSMQVAEALKKGLEQTDPTLEILSIPLSDGGEGFLDAFVSVVPGKFITIDVSGPLGEITKARYYVAEDDQLAIVEMAEAAGLIKMKKEDRNPLKTSTYGLGQIIHHALDGGIRDFIIGIGGSATTDGGAGMAQALGARFFRRDGSEITRHLNGELIGQCHTISLENLYSAVRECHVKVACDVDNPLLGPRGAVYTYSLQKGASPEELPILEANMQNYSRLLESTFQRNISMISGAGAAGGLGAGLLAFINAELVSGIDLILDTVKFNDLLDGADLVITGEGKIDDQTLQGKVLSGVVKRAGDKSIPVVAVTGKLELSADAVGKLGISRVISLTELSGSEKSAISNSKQLLFEIGKSLLDSDPIKN